MRFLRIRNAPSQLLVSAATHPELYNFVSIKPSPAGQKGTYELVCVIAVLIASASSDGSGESAHMRICADAQTRQNIRCSHTQSMDVYKSSDQNLDI